ncbi:hypothetical protein LCGC14_2793550, partial [marine sediment metagenome]
LDRTQRPISHLYNLLYRVNFFYSKKIFPIFVFDGKVSELKRVITKDQLKDFLFTKKWYEGSMKQGSRGLAREIALSKEYMWQNILEESKQLLGALGVPYIETPASAEAQCAYLVKKGVAQLSNSQDFDSLLFGCPNLVQNLSKSLRRKVQGKWRYEKIVPMVTNLQKTLKLLDISIFQLIDLSLLIETDYFPGIKGIGPKKGLKYIKQHKNIETIISCEKDKYDFTDFQIEFDFAKGIDVFFDIHRINMYFVVDKNVKNFRWEIPIATNLEDTIRIWGIGWTRYNQVFLDNGLADSGDSYLYDNPAVVTASNYQVAHEFTRYKELKLLFSPYSARSIRYNVILGESLNTDETSRLYSSFPLAPNPRIQEIEVYSVSTPISNITSNFSFESSETGALYLLHQDSDSISTTKA